MVEDLIVAKEIDGMNFEEALSKLEKDITTAQEYLQKNGTLLLKEIADKQITSLGGVVKTFLDRIVSNVRNKVGKCDPLSKVFKNVLISTCDKIIQPIVSNM